MTFRPSIDSNSILVRLIPVSGSQPKAAGMTNIRPKRLIVLLISCLTLTISATALAQGPRMPTFPPAAPEKPSTFDQELIKPTPTPQKTEEKSPESIGITKNDYQAYLKSGQRSPKWDELIEPAFTAFDADNLATASIFLQKAYDLGCRDPLVLYRLGLYAETRGETKKSADLFDMTADQILKRHQTHPLAKTAQKTAANALYRVQKFERAKVRIDKALEVAPDDFLMLFMAGQISRMNKDRDAALSYFERAEKNFKPELGLQAAVPLYRELTSLICAKSDFDRCIEYANKLEVVSPNDPISQAAFQKQRDMEFKVKEQQLLDSIMK